MQKTILHQKGITSLTAAYVGLFIFKENMNILFTVVLSIYFYAGIWIVHVNLRNT